MPQLDIEKIESIRKELITKIDNIFQGLHELFLQHLNTDQVHLQKEIQSVLIIEINKTIQKKFNLFFKQLWKITDFPKYIEQVIRYTWETTCFITTLISQRTSELESYPNDNHCITDRQIECLIEDLPFTIYTSSTSLTIALFISPITNALMFRLENDTETSGFIPSISSMLKALEAMSTVLHMSMFRKVFTVIEQHMSCMSVEMQMQDCKKSQEISSAISHYQNELNGIVEIANCINNTFEIDTLPNTTLTLKTLSEIQNRCIQEAAFDDKNPEVIASKMIFTESISAVIKEIQGILKQAYIASLKADDYFSLPHHDFPLAFIKEKDVIAISNALLDSLYQYHLLGKSDFEVRIAMFKFRKMLIELNTHLSIPISFIKNRSDNHHDFFQSIQKCIKKLCDAYDPELIEFEKHQVTTKLISDRIHTFLNYSVKIFLSIQKESMLNSIYQAVSNPERKVHERMLRILIQKSISFAIDSIETVQSFQDKGNMLAVIKEWNHVLTEFYTNTIFSNNPHAIFLELKKLNETAQNKPEPFQTVVIAINQIVLDRTIKIEVKARLLPIIGQPKISSNTAHSQILYDLKHVAKPNKIKRLLIKSDELNIIFHEVYQTLDILVIISSFVFNNSRSLEAYGLSFEQFRSIPNPKYQDKFMVFSREDAISFRSLLPRNRMPESNPYYDYLSEKARVYLNCDPSAQTQYEYDRLRAQFEYYATSHRIFLSNHTPKQKLKLLHRYYKQNHHKWARHDSLSRWLKVLIPLSLLIVFLFSTSSLLVLACAVLNHGLLHSINMILYLAQRIVLSGWISLLPVTAIIVASIAITILTKNILQMLFLSADEKQAKHHFMLMTKLIQNINHDAPIIKDAVIIESEVFEENDQPPSMKLFEETFTAFAKNSAQYTNTDFFKTQVTPPPDSGAGVGLRDSELQILR